MKYELFFIPVFDFHCFSPSLPFSLSLFFLGFSFYIKLTTLNGRVASCLCFLICRKMGLLRGLAYCVGFCEILWAAWCGSLRKFNGGLTVVSLLPIGCPRKPLGPRQTRTLVTPTTPLSHSCQVDKLVTCRVAYLCVLSLSSLPENSSSEVFLLQDSEPHQEARILFEEGDGGRVWVVT